MESGKKEVPFEYPLDWKLGILFSVNKMPPHDPKRKLLATISDRVTQGPTTKMPRCLTVGGLVWTGILSIISPFRVKVRSSSDHRFA